MLTPAQLEKRRLGIGGSDVAAIVGASPWKAPIDVWLDKTGKVDNAETFNTERGNFLEDGLRRWTAKRLGLEIHEGETLFSPTRPYVLATPDGVAATGAVEIKAPSWLTADDWGEPGTDAIPSYNLPQVTFEAHVTERPGTHVAAFSGGDLALYWVPFNQKLFEFLADAAARFWRDHVLTGVPPPPDSTDRYADYLASKFPKSRGELIGSSAMADEAALRLKAARRRLEAAERDKLAAENILKAFIGNNDGVESAHGRITWRSPKDGVKVDWEALARKLGANDVSIAAHSCVVPGSRRMLTPREWAKE